MIFFYFFIRLFQSHNLDYIFDEISQVNRALISMVKGLSWPIFYVFYFILFQHLNITFYFKKINPTPLETWTPRLVTMKHRQVDVES